MKEAGINRAVRSVLAAVTAVSLAACTPTQAPVNTSGNGGSAIAGAPKTTSALMSPAPGPLTTIGAKTRIGSMPYGHTYMVHGRVDANGEPADRHYVGFQPKSGFGGLLVGTALRVDGTLKPSYPDLNFPVLASYRHLLTTAQYRDLQTAIADFQRNMPKWTLFDTTCNWFAAKMALAAGLWAFISSEASIRFAWESM